MMCFFTRSLMLCRVLGSQVSEASHTGTRDPSVTLPASGSRYEPLSLECATSVRNRLTILNRPKHSQRFRRFAFLAAPSPRSAYSYGRSPWRGALEAVTSWDSAGRQRRKRMMRSQTMNGLASTAIGAGRSAGAPSRTVRHTPIKSTPCPFLAGVLASRKPLALSARRMTHRHQAVAYGIRPGGGCNTRGSSRVIQAIIGIHFTFRSHV
jgi:hypothetical protein